MAKGFSRRVVVTDMRRVTQRGDITLISQRARAAFVLHVTAVNVGFSATILFLGFCGWVFLFVFFSLSVSGRTGIDVLMNNQCLFLVGFSSLSVALGITLIRRLWSRARLVALGLAFLPS